jgi:hypothetical protein
MMKCQTTPPQVGNHHPKVRPRQNSGEGEGWWCRGGDEGMRGGVGIVTAGEITVVRSNDWTTSQEENSDESRRMTHSCSGLPSWHLAYHPIG